MSESKLPDKEAEKQDDYTYEEIHSNSLTDLTRSSKDEQVGAGTEVAGADTKPGDTPAVDAKDTPPADETPQKDGEPVKPDAQTTPNNPVDVEELTKKAVKEAVTETVKALVGEKATDEEKDAMTEKLNAALKSQPWVTEKRNPTYEELAAFQIKFVADSVKESVKSEIKEDLQKEVEDEEKAAADQEKTQQEQAKVYHEKWDQQIKHLEDKNLIPKGDEGATVQKKLFEIMKARVASGRPTDNLIEIYYDDYKPALDELEKQKTAPVGGQAHGGSSGSNNQTYSYADLHNSKVSDIIKEVRTQG